MNAVTRNVNNTALSSAMIAEIAKKLPQITFDPKWHNGTGYFNGAVDADVQHTATFTDENGRIGIIIPLDIAGEENANLVIFQRDTTSRVCANVPLGYNKKTFDGSVGRFPTKGEYGNVLATDGFTLAYGGSWNDPEDFSDALVTDLDNLLALA